MSQKTGLTFFHPQGRAGEQRAGIAMLTATETHEFSRMERAAVYRAIFTRRDVRSHFTGEPMDDELLARLLLAAHHAPSVGFMQPWDFIIIRSTEQRSKIRDLFVEARFRETDKMSTVSQPLYRKLRLEGICESTLNICITCDRSRAKEIPLGRTHNSSMDLFSTVCAVQNLWLAARAEGIGVGWVSIIDEAALTRLLQLPSHVVPVAYLCVGPVTDFAQRPDLEKQQWRERLDPSTLVMSERFSGSGEDSLKDALRKMGVPIPK